MASIQDRKIKIQSTSLDGTVKSIQLNHQQFKIWIQKSEKIEQVLAKFSPGGSQNELVLIRLLLILFFVINYYRATLAKSGMF